MIIESLIAELPTIHRTNRCIKADSIHLQHSQLKQGEGGGITPVWIYTFV